MPLAGQVRPQAEADVRDVVADREDEEARGPALALGVGGEVAPPPLGGIEQLGEVVGIPRPVVERVLAGIAPARHRVRVGLGHGPDREHGRDGSDTAADGPHPRLRDAPRARLRRRGALVRPAALAGVGRRLRPRGQARGRLAGGRRALGVGLQARRPRARGRARDRLRSARGPDGRGRGRASCAARSGSPSSPGPTTSRSCWSSSTSSRSATRSRRSPTRCSSGARCATR